MRRIENPARVKRLIDEAVSRFELDLSGMRVLTETASGPFVVTPLIAARAGAEVIAVTRDSRFAAAGEVGDYTLEWARRLGLEPQIEIYLGAGADRAADADLVTNLGFVRPIDAGFVERLRPDAAVSLMCEPWEVRASDVDLRACRAAGLPVAGTNERDPRLQTFRFVGMLALKLLLELDVEVVLGRIIVISSEPFAAPIVELLASAGAEVELIDVTCGGDLLGQALLDGCAHTDAVVVAEHRDRRAVIGGRTGIPVEPLAESGVVVAHIAGMVEDPHERLRKHPAGHVVPGRMTVTTDIVGPRPVIDLHAAGLRVGQALVAGVRRFGRGTEAEAAVASEPLSLAADI